MVMTPDAVSIQLHPKQRAYALSNRRFNIVPAGRRSGKTWIAKLYRLIFRALSETKWPDANFFAAAPTRAQAKFIYWTDLKNNIPKKFITKVDESHLIISLVNGARIFVLGMDKPERAEGIAWNGGILDEYGNMKKTVWTEHLRPVCADRGAWIDFIGVPEGRNHYFDLYSAALMPENALDWAVFEWWTEEVLPLYLGIEAAESEIAAAKRDMDPLTFDQEFRGSFVTFEGRAYYQFDRKKHCCKTLEYDPKHDLILCFDFNRAPGVAAILQEQEIGTCAIGEVFIPKNSNTGSVCRKIIADWGEHLGKVYVYGDATGGAKGSAKVAGSDWDIVEDYLEPAFHDGIVMEVPKSNPRERARVNAVNSRLESASGEVNFFVDPGKSPMLARDLDSVVTLAGGSGEIDKDHDSSLTHISDAVGYYLEREFSTTQRVLEVTTI